MPHQYPADVRQRVLALLDAGTKVAVVAPNSTCSEHDNT